MNSKRRIASDGKEITRRAEKLAYKNLLTSRVASKRLKSLRRSLRRDDGNASPVRPLHVCDNVLEIPLTRFRVQPSFGGNHRTSSRSSHVKLHQQPLATSRVQHHPVRNVPPRPAASTLAPVSRHRRPYRHRHPRILVQLFHRRVKHALFARRRQQFIRRKPRRARGYTEPNQTNHPVRRPLNRAHRFLGNPFIRHFVVTSRPRRIRRLNLVARALLILILLRRRRG